MKKIKCLLFVFLISFLCILKVNAFSITGVTSTTVGSSIAVKIEASGLTGRFDVSTSNSSVLSGGKSIWLENNSTTLYFSANKVGTASVTVNATDVSDESGNTFTGKRILYVTVKEKSSSQSSTKNPSVDVNKKYNSNNYLKSLSIEGYELTPEFNKDTLEYNVDLNIDTTKINVLATTEDKTANIKGVGEVSVNDGPNTIIVTVTAENGNERQYKINATVLEPDPIEVKVNNKKYTIVRKKGQVENIPTGFIEDKITIENQEVVSYKSDITKINLVALKDEEGNIKLFIYDLENKKFEEFYEAKASGLNLIILNDIDNIPFDFIKTTFDYNGVKIDGYKFKDDKENRYFLVYAQNLENASKEFYLYDNKEGTFQRYFDDIVNIKNNSIKIRGYIIIGFISLFSLIILIKIFKLFSSKENKIKKYQRKIEKLKNKLDDSYDISKVDIKEEPVIRQIDEDEYIVPKKSRKQKIKEIEEAKRKLDDSKPSYKRVSLDEDDFDD